MSFHINKNINKNSNSNSIGSTSSKHPSNQIASLQMDSYPNLTHASLPPTLGLAQTLAGHLPILSPPINNSPEEPDDWDTLMAEIFSDSPTGSIVHLPQTPLAPMTKKSTRLETRKRPISQILNTQTNREPPFLTINDALTSIKRSPQSQETQFQKIFKDLKINQLPAETCQAAIYEILKAYQNNPHNYVFYGRLIQNLSFENLIKFAKPILAFTHQGICFPNIIQNLFKTLDQKYQHRVHELNEETLEYIILNQHTSLLYIEKLIEYVAGGSLLKLIDIFKYLLKINYKSKEGGTLFEYEHLIKCFCECYQNLQKNILKQSSNGLAAYQPKIKELDATLKNYLSNYIQTNPTSILVFALYNLVNDQFNRLDTQVLSIILQHPDMPPEIKNHILKKLNQTKLKGLVDISFKSDL